MESTHVIEEIGPCDNCKGTNYNIEEKEDKIIFTCANCKRQIIWG